MDAIDAFLDAPPNDAIDAFLDAPEKPEEIRARYQTGSGFPSYGEAKSVLTAEQNRPLRTKVAAGVNAAASGLISAGKQFLGSAKRGVEEVSKDLGTQSIPDPQAVALNLEPNRNISISEREKQLAEMNTPEKRAEIEAYYAAHPGVMDKLWASGADAYGRMFKGLNALGQKAYNKVSDYLSPGDPVAQFQARWTADLQKQRELAQQPGILPKKEIYPNVAEAGSYVVSPPGLGAVGKLFGKAGKAEVAGAGTLSKYAGKASALAEKTAELAKAPANKIANIERNLVGDTTAISQAARTPAIPVVAGAKGVQKAADAVEQAGRTVGDSELSRLEQIAMSEAAPPAVRKLAQAGIAVGADKAVDAGINTAKAAGTGAAINAALAVPGAENPEELGQAAGSGAAVGGLTHLMLSPTASVLRKKQAQTADVARWESSKTPQEQAAIVAANVSPEVKLKHAVVESIANGILDRDANIQFLYGDSKAAQAAGVGANRGAAYIEGDRPTIFINTDKMNDGTAYHELWHQITRSPDIVDYGDFVTRLIGVRDDQGNVIKPGILDDAAVKSLGDTYYNQLDKAAQETLTREKQVFDLNPQDPLASSWRNRIISEVGAEMFSNLSKDTPGNLIKAADAPIQKVLDAMVLQTKSSAIQKLGQKISAVLGRDPQTESDIFPGLKATPEIYAVMRDYVRNKKGLTSSPTFEGPMLLDTETKVDPKAVAKDQALLQKFSDNDIFVKNPDGTIRMQNGAPVMRSERQIKSFQAQRAAAMMTGMPQGTTPGSVQLSNTALGGTAPATAISGSTPAQKGASYSGKFFDDPQMTFLMGLPDDLLTPSQKAKIKTLNDVAKKQDGTPFMIWYNAATKNKKYSSAISESVRSAVPLTMNISKAGNFFVTTMDLTVLNQKIQRWAAAKPKAFDLFNNSQSVFFDKMKQALDNHQKGLPGATGLDPDPVTARQMFLRINDVINIRDMASELNNPARLSKAAGDDNLIRSFRFDRVNRIEQSPSAEKFPINYEMQKMVFQPNKQKVTYAGKEIDAPREFYRGFVSGDTRRISTGNSRWDGYLFVSSDVDQAKNYGPELKKFVASPDAKILYEGTPEFRKLSRGVSKNTNLLTYTDQVTARAADQGYDAVWWQLQGTVGTAIINRSKFQEVPLSGGSEQKLFSPSPEEQPLTLFHGTKRAFEQFQTGVPNRRGMGETDRMYFSEEPDAAFDALRSGKAAKQVDVGRFAMSDPDLGLDSPEDFFSLEPADQAKVIDNLKNDLARGIEAGGKLISIRDDGGYGVVSKEDLAKMNMDQLDSSMFFPKAALPRLLKAEVSGKTLDISDKKKPMPAGLAEALKQEGRWDRDTDYTGYGHEYSKALVDWARRNGYSRIRVPESYETGGKSKTSWIVLPEALPKKFEDVFDTHLGPYNRQNSVGAPQ